MCNAAAVYYTDCGNSVYNVKTQMIFTCNVDEPRNQMWVFDGLKVSTQWLVMYDFNAKLKLYSGSPMCEEITTCTYHEVVQVLRKRAATPRSCTSYKSVDISPSSIAENRAFNICTSPTSAANIDQYIVSNAPLFAHGQSHDTL